MAYTPPTPQELAAKRAEIETAVAFKGAIDITVAAHPTDWESFFTTAFSSLQDQLGSAVTAKTADYIAAIPAQTSRPATRSSNGDADAAAVARMRESFGAETTTETAELRVLPERDKDRNEVDNGPLPAWVREKCARLGITCVQDQRTWAKGASRSGKPRPPFKIAPETRGLSNEAKNEAWNNAKGLYPDD